jgi:hypothetical protein
MLPATLEYFYRCKIRKDGLSGKCKKCISDYGKTKWATMNPIEKEKRKKQQEIWRCANLEYMALAQCRYRERHPEKVAEYRKWYEATCRENILARAKKHRSTPKYRISYLLAAHIRESLRSGRGGKWESMVDFTLNELKDHLESQFKRGMTWENYGDWHIDHIRPIADFNFNSPDDPEFKICWSIWNLQPLWAAENIQKGQVCESLPLPLALQGVDHENL